MLRFFLVLAIASVALAFSPSGRFGLLKVRQMNPLNENFGFDFSEDSYANTPKQILGEANYVKFVQSYDEKALRVSSGSRYDIIERIRALKLLTATADSGLLEALEAKGLTLAKVEKLLPLIDRLNLLPLLVKNKETLVGLAPLLIEPAPALLPVLTGLLNTSPSSFILPGLTLAGVGGYELTLGGNGFLGVFEVLFGLPLIALGSVLKTLDSLDNLPPVPKTPISITSASTPVSSSPSSSSSSSSRPRVAARSAVSSASRPSVSARAAATTTPNATVKVTQNGKRKTIRIK